MACNPDFVQFIIDQCSDAGEIAVKKMMGDWCAYCDGVLFGLICDNNFYVKVTEPGKALLKEVILRPPYDGAKDYFYISDVDDRSSKFHHLDHFCRRDDEWLDGEVLDVSCHEVGVFLGKSNFVEHNILWIREVDAFG